MPIFDFPAAPVLNELYEENGVQYVWNGSVWLTGASAPGYVLRAGDTMAGPLYLPDPNPIAPLESAHKKYVDETVATQSLWQSVWAVAANTPDLDPAVALPLHGYSWTAITVDPNVPELAPANLPGIGGLAIASNDTVVWNNNALEYEHVKTPLNASAMLVQDTPPPGAFHGQQWWDSDSGKHYVFYDDGTSQQWVQSSGGGGGSAVGITDAPADGTPYERQDGGWVSAGAATTPGPVAVPVADTFPATPVQGQLHFLSTDASLYIYFDDSTSAQWIEVSAP
jgi:hypothetical protein